MAENYLAFSDRKLGFFERGEHIRLKVDPSSCATKAETVDAWGEKYAEYEIDGENLSLGEYPVGWYRIFLKNGEGERIDHSYIAFTVTVPMSERYKGETCFATDVAGEYSDSTMDLAEEIIKSVKLQGFELIRGRCNIDLCDAKVLGYRQKLRNNGLKTMDVAMNGHDQMPRIADIDLRDVYNLFRSSLDREGIVISDVVELVNEPDLAFGHPALPDAMTAYCKAAFLGISDSSPSPNAAMPGLALGRDDIYADIMLQNGMLDYSPMYNFHGYDQISVLATYARRVALAYAPEGETRAAFMSESGKKAWCGEDGVVFDSHMMTMSRYAVSAAVSILSQGIDKWFWFISRAYLESGGGFGSLHAWTYQPYPVTAVLSNMTYQLGRAEYVGILSDLPQKCKGYMFDNGMGDHVAVLFANDPCSVKIFADNATVVDLFGRETAVTSINGEIGIDVSTDPVFVRFSGYADEKNYYKSSYKVMPLEKPVYSKEKRVVVNAVWGDQDLSQTLVMQKGYIIKEGKDERVTLRIYNFNGEKISGKAFVKAEYEDHFEIIANDTHFEVEPFGCACVEVILKPSSDLMNCSGDLKFAVEVDGFGEISPAVCRYWFKIDNMPVADEDIARFKNFIYPESWNLKNIDAPGTIDASANEDAQSITFRPQHNGGYAQWYFPVYKVQNPEIFEGTDGIVFRKRNSYETKNSNKLTVFLITKDGRSFWSGHSSAAPTSVDWRTVTYPWETFGLYSSPEGMNDIRPFIPSDIVTIRVGVSGTSSNTMPELEIKDLGVYYDRFVCTSPHPQKIVFEGVVEGEIINEPHGRYVTAVLPDVELDDVRVFDGHIRLDRFDLDGKHVIIDLSGLERGEHVLQVSARSELNYRYSSFITFYIR